MAQGVDCALDARDKSLRVPHYRSTGKTGTAPVSTASR